MKKEKNSNSYRTSPSGLQLSGKGTYARHTCSVERFIDGWASTGIGKDLTRLVWSRFGRTKRSNGSIFEIHETNEDLVKNQNLKKKKPISKVGDGCPISNLPDSFDNRASGTNPGGLMYVSYRQGRHSVNKSINTEGTLGSMSIATYVKAREQTWSEVKTRAKMWRCVVIDALTSESRNVIDWLREGPQGLGGSNDGIGCASRVVFIDS